MARSILEGTQLWDTVVMQGANWKTAGLAITADFAMPDDPPPTMWFDAVATNRNIALPRISGNASASPMEGRLHSIVNVSVSAVLTINTASADGSTLVTTVPPGFLAEFQVVKGVWRAGTSAGKTGGPSAPQASKYVLNTTVGATTAAVGDMTGAAFVVAEYSAVGAANLTTRTAAQIIADQGAAVGDSWMFMLRNSSGGTTTLVAGSGVTITSTATVATVTERMYNVKVVSASAVTFQNVGGGIAA